MIENIKISGFADEISDSLDKQIEVVKQLGMQHISIRGVDGKSINDYNYDEFVSNILPRLNQNGIKISSIGSPIGKVFIDDQEGFEKQLIDLANLCKIAQVSGCKYIRMFSFFIKPELNYDDYQNEVICKLKQYTKIAEDHNIILLHENEKDIFGDIPRRCKLIIDEVNSENFKAIFDFANFVQCQINPIEAYELLKQHIEYIHIKDASYSVSYNVLAGTGDGKIEEILTDAIKNGYQGFLTLEPHLAMFGSLKSLELDDVESVVNTDANISGEDGYKMQYVEVVKMLKKIKEKI